MTIDVHVSTFPFTMSGIMAHAPSSPGVYAVYPDADVLYIGEGEDICDGSVDLQNGVNPSPLQAGPSGFSFEIVMHGEMRVARQHALIVQLRP